MKHCCNGKRGLIAAVAVIACMCSFAESRRESRGQAKGGAQNARYDYRFGEQTPFLPSNATTESGRFIDARAFPSAAYCRPCHQNAYHQWRESLHSNSFRAPFYTKNVNLLTASKGIEFTRHCEGCHNPIALLSGALTETRKDEKRSFDADGITCSVCHSIQKLAPSYGLGSYVMGVPAVIVDKNGNPIPGKVPYSMILAHPERHALAVMKDFYRTPEYCGACHKANLPASLNGYKWLRAIGLSDEWQASAYSHRSPLPFYTKDEKSCQSCHMGREPLERDDAGAKDNTFASHRWLGGNTAVPFYYGYQEQLQRTSEFLRAQRLDIDIFALRTGRNTDYIAPLGTKDFDIQPGERVEMAVVIQNRGLGHTLIPEQRDIYEAWVEFSVSDTGGRILYESGGLQPDGTLDPTAHTFTNRMLDASGGLLTKHEVWLRHTLAVDTTIRPGRSNLVRYQFQMPAEVTGPLTATVKVNYRHLNRAFTTFALGAGAPSYPVIEMAARSLTLQLGANHAKETQASNTPEWMRWNNFGIALLDQERYEDAIQAFTKVQQLRPDYSDGYTNAGVVYVEWEKEEEALKYFKKAREVSPGNSRAAYYEAVADEMQGQFPDAINQLQGIVQNFPLSPDARRELGSCYYQTRQYSAALEQYSALQTINPDDLQAHYRLSLIYRRMGLDDKAKQEAARFADEQDDQLTNQSILSYLRSTPDASRESEPWHLHVLSSAVVSP